MSASAALHPTDLLIELIAAEKRSRGASRPEQAALARALQALLTRLVLLMQIQPVLHMQSVDEFKKEEKDAHKNSVSVTALVQPGPPHSPTTGVQFSFLKIFEQASIKVNLIQDIKTMKPSPVALYHVVGVTSLIDPRFYRGFSEQVQDVVVLVTRQEKDQESSITVGPFYGKGLPQNWVRPSYEAQIVLNPNQSTLPTVQPHQLKKLRRFLTTDRNLRAVVVFDYETDSQADVSRADAIALLKSMHVMADVKSSSMLTKGDVVVYCVRCAYEVDHLDVNSMRLRRVEDAAKRLIILVQRGRVMPGHEVQKIKNIRDDPFHNHRLFQTAIMYDEQHSPVDTLLYDEVGQEDNGSFYDLLL
jgi:hypothetical protein